MRNKIFSFLLIFCILACAYPLSAFAADYTPYATQVVVNRGDTVSALCRARGLDYESVQTAVLILNGYAKPASLNAIRPGETLWLPKTANDAKTIETLHATEGPANAIQYTVKKGDTMFSICTAMRINYSASKEEIKKLNGWSTDKDLSKIYVGQKIYLPMTTKQNTVPTAVTPTASTTPTPTTQNTSRSASDKLEYYIVSHKMAAGETVNGICDGLGAKYSSKVSDIVKALNNLTNLSNVKAGKEYYFPSTSSNNAVFALYSHTIVGGDTTSKLCAAYGVNYETVRELLERLNPGFKLTSIPVGKTMYLIGTAVQAPAPSTPAPVTSTPAATTPTGTNGYNGTYAENAAKRATITVSGTAQASNVSVHWSNGAAQSIDWVFQGAFNENGLLQYNNCTKSTTAYNAAGSASKAINYQNGTGWLYYVNGALYWHDNQENVADGTYFTKVK